MVNNDRHDSTLLVGPLQPNHPTPKQALEPLGYTVRIAQVIEEKAGSSKDAQRKSNQRKREELLGLKPISLSLPIELHSPLQTLARLIKGGSPADAAIMEAFMGVLANNAVQDSQTASQESSDIETLLIALIHSLPPWRKWIISLLLKGLVKLGAMKKTIATSGENN